MKYAKMVSWVLSGIVMLVILVGTLGCGPRYIVTRTSSSRFEPKARFAIVSRHRPESAPEPVHSTQTIEESAESSGSEIVSTDSIQEPTRTEHRSVGEPLRRSRTYYGPVRVRGYWRGGRYVRPYTRRRPR